MGDKLIILTKYSQQYSKNIVLLSIINYFIIKKTYKSNTKYLKKWYFIKTNYYYF